MLKLKSIKNNKNAALLQHKNTMNDAKKYNID